MNDRLRLIAILAGAALLGLVVLLRTRPSPAPARARPVHTAEAEPLTAEAPAAPAAHAQGRQARDAMRAQIVEALRRRDGRPAPAAAPASASLAAAHRPAPLPDDDLPHGHYEASYIQQTFREDMFPILRQCYDSALKRLPALSGKLVLSFSIVGDSQVGGVVEDASIADDSTLHDTEMETCVGESLLALTFDKPPSGGGLVTVRYPIAFSPGEDNEAGAPDAQAP